MPVPLSADHVYEFRARYIVSQSEQEFNCIRTYRMQNMPVGAPQSTLALLQEIIAAWREAVLPTLPNTITQGFYEMRAYSGRIIVPKSDPIRYKMLGLGFDQLAWVLPADQGALDMVNDQISPPWVSVSILNRTGIALRSGHSSNRMGPVVEADVTNGVLTVPAHTRWQAAADFHQQDIALIDASIGDPCLFSKKAFLESAVVGVVPSSFCNSILDSDAARGCGSQVSRKKSSRTLGF